MMLSFKFNRKSFALILALWILVAFSVIAMTAMYVVSRKLDEYVNQINSLKGQYLAESAKNYFLEYVTPFDNDLMGNPQINKELGGENFQFSINYDTDPAPTARTASMTLTGSSPGVNRFISLNIIEDENQNDEIIKKVKKYNAVIKNQNPITLEDVCITRGCTEWYTAADCVDNCPSTSGATPDGCCEVCYSSSNCTDACPSTSGGSPSGCCEGCYSSSNCTDACPSTNYCCEGCYNSSNCTDSCPSTSSCCEGCYNSSNCTDSCPSTSSCCEGCYNSSNCTDTCPSTSSCCEGCYSSSNCTDSCPSTSSCCEACYSSSNCTDSCPSTSSCCEGCYSSCFSAVTNNYYNGDCSQDTAASCCLSSVPSGYEYCCEAVSCQCQTAAYPCKTVCCPESDYPTWSTTCDASYSCDSNWEQSCIETGWCACSLERETGFILAGGEPQCPCCLEYGDWTCKTIKLACPGGWKTSCSNYECSNYDCSDYECSNYECSNYECSNYECRNYDCKNYKCKTEDCTAWRSPTFHSTTYFDVSSVQVTTNYSPTANQAIWGESTDAKNLYVNGSLDLDNISDITKYGVWGDAYAKDAITDTIGAIHGSEFENCNSVANPDECSWSVTKPAIDTAYYDRLFVKAQAMTAGDLPDITTTSSGSSDRQLKGKNIFVNGNVTISTDSDNPLEGPGNIIAIGTITISNSAHIEENIGLISKTAVNIGQSARVGRAKTGDTSGEFIQGKGVFIYVARDAGTTVVDLGYYSKTKAYILVVPHTSGTTENTIKVSDYHDDASPDDNRYARLQGLIYTEGLHDETGEVYGYIYTDNLTNDQIVMLRLLEDDVSGTPVESQRPIKIRGLYNIGIANLTYK
ncbi:MAG: hypothetical protein KJ593_04065 [Candidatus Omnitrophica bacterium]|nr:hypothetical protein [Candidatus Omnitrophota bacterium]